MKSKVVRCIEICNTTAPMHHVGGYVVVCCLLVMSDE